MGGRGSGRTSSYGASVSKCHETNSIDFEWLERKKLFNVGRWSTLTWSRGGREIGSIRIEAQQSGTRLSYRARQSGDTWQEISELVPIVETKTNFDGRRRWFLCLSCRRRCRILYGGIYFRCRRCHHLKYESQYESGYSRAADQAHALRKRLGQVGSLDEPFPHRPKGMHSKTYRRLKQMDEHLQQRWAVGVMGWMQRFR